MKTRNHLQTVSLIFGLAAFSASGIAAAGLSTQADYYCWSNGSGVACELPTNGVHASASESTPLSVGDGHGGAGAQSNYGQLTGNASGSWLPASASPGYTSSGNISANFADSITLAGGAGNVQVSAIMDLAGTFTEALSYTNGTGVFLLSLHFSYGGGTDYYSQVFLYKTLGGSEIDFGTNQTGSWTSADGVFSSPGNNTGLAHISPSGQLALSLPLPYNTPIQFKASLFVAGNNSVATAGSANVKLIVPAGTTVSSVSGQTYSANTLESSDVPLPAWSLFLLGSMLVRAVSRAGRIGRRAAWQFS